MKKRIFALALALCMMVSVMPNAFANGVLTLGDGTDTGVLTLDNGTSGRSTTTSASVQPRQDGVLYNTGSEGDTTPVADPVDDPVIIDTTTYSGTNTDNGYIGNGGPMAPAGWPKTQPAANGVADPLVTSKTVDWNESTGKYEVRLESYVTGSYETKTTTTVETDPLDVILILDRSSRMSETKMAQLKTAANSFLTELQKNSPNSRVAIVSYANQNGSTVDTNSNAADYTALVNITDSNKVNSVLTTAISNLGTAGSGNAYSDEAFEKAVRIFQSLTTYEARADVPDCDNERMVIFFTAGIPGVAGEGWDYDIGGFFGWGATYPAYNIAQKSIHWSAILKANEGTNANISSQQFWRSEYYDSSDYGTRTGCGSKVYCVGIDLPTCVNHSHSYSNNDCDGTKINEYLYRVSSHRSDGTHVPKDIQNEWENTSVFRDYNYPDLYTKGNIEGSHVTGTKYYLAGEIDDVAGMLKQTISTTTTREGGPDVELTSAAVLKDVISPYFKLDGAVTVKTADYDYNVSGNFKNETVSSLTAVPDGKNITVTGFNYGENWCGINKNEGVSSPHGKKLIVEFNIIPEDGFMGGNNVPTNGYDSGVYAKSSATTPLEHFSYPLVNVTIPKPVVEVEGEQVIYYGETAPAIADLYTKITPTETDAWKYDFVELTYTVPNGVNNDACGVYDFKLNVKPIASATTDVGTPAVAIDSDVAQVKVHVLEAVLDAKDDTIYLGDTTDLNELVEHSWACGCDDDKVIRADSDAAPDVDYWFDDTARIASEREAVYAPADHDCEDITVTCNRGNDSDEFTVHVVKPVFTNTDTTIYLGNSVDLNSLMNEADNWVCDNTCEDQQSLAKGAAPKKPTHSYTGGNTTVSPKACTAYAVVTKVAGTTVYTGEINVHVIQPTITFADQEIYLSQIPEYEAPAFVWDQTCSGEHTDIPTVSGDDTKDSFKYDYDKDPDAFVKCTDVNVTVKIDNVDYSEYVTLKNGEEERGADVEEFTVHVYLPKIVLESQNLWADYDCDVTLTDGMKAPAITKWLDQCGNGAEKTHSNEAPKCSDPVYEFKLGNKVITSYNAKTEGVTDQATIDVALNKIKIGNTEYTFSNVEAVEYTITVNKFDLTINKTWNGAAVYKQDAIFTVSGGLGDFQVVLPANQSSIKISGLLCGQTYTVSEDEAWTWRWSAKQTDDITSHSHGVSTEAPTEHSDTSVTFENSLINRLWLSFCTFVQNIFGQAAIQKGGN